MNSNQSTFKAICQFVKPHLASAVKDNDFEFEKKLAATKNLIQQRFAPEMDEKVLSKMIADLEFQVRIAHEQATQIVLAEQKPRANFKRVTASAKESISEEVKPDSDSPERTLYQWLQEGLAEQHEKGTDRF